MIAPHHSPPRRERLPGPTELWHWLTEPVASVREPDRRRQAQLLASIFLLLTPLGFVAVLLPYVFQPGSSIWFDPAVQVMILSALLAVAVYVLSRTRYYALAALLAIGLASVTIFMAAFPEVRAHDFSTLSYLILPVLIGSLFLSIRLAALITVINLVGVALWPAFMPGISFHEVGSGPLSFLAIVSLAVMLAAHYRDLLERDQQAKIQRNEERLRQIIQNMPVMISAFDADWNIVTWNRECEQVTGYRADEIVNRPEALRLLYPDEAYRAQLRREADARGPQYRDWEWQITCRDGGVRTIAWSSISERFPLPGWATWDLGVDVTERKRAEEAEREQRLLAEALRGIASTLNSTLNLDEVLDHILANVGRVVPHESANVMLIDAGREMVHVARSRGYAERGLENWVKNLHLKVAEIGNLRWMLETGQPLLIPDALAYREWVQFPETRWLRSHVSAPICIRGQVVGFLNLDSSQPGYYMPDHAERLRVFADEAAIAIVNSQLYAETQRRLNHLTLLYECSQDLALTRDTRAAIAAVVTRVTRRFGASSASYLTYNECDDTIHLDFEYWEGKTTAGDGSMPPEQVCALSDYPHVASALRMRTPRTLRRDDPDLAPIEHKMLERWNGHTVVIIPVATRDRLLGYFEVWDSRAEQKYDESDLQLMFALATQAGIAIENTQLFESAQRRLAEQSALLEASTAISSSLDLMTVLRRMAEQMGRAIDATSVHICDWNEDISASTVMAEYYGPAASPGERTSGSCVSYTPAEFGEPLYTQMLAGRTLVVQIDDPELPALMRGRLQRHRQGSALIVPLVVKQILIGYSAVWESRRRREFAASEIALCQGIAQQAAIVIENVRLYDALRRYAEELEQRVQERTAELEHERARTQALIDAAGEGILLTDRGFIVQYANTAQQQVTGYSLTEMLGRTPRLWRSDLTPRSVYGDMYYYLDQGETWRGEVINRRKDGSLYDAALTITPLKNADGEVTGYVGLQRDISYLKELDRLKNQFVSRIGHELRTPVANVKLYLDLLERGRPDKRDQYIQILHQEATRLQKLIEGFLEISQLDTGAIQVQSLPVDLNHIVADLVAGHKVVADECGLSLDCRVQPAMPRALADPSLIGHVIANLIENALSYTSPGGCITLATGLHRLEDRNWVTAVVRDTGRGISAEEMPHLFERFYRGEAARDFTTPGAGLGLAICKEIVSRMNGRLTVDSQPGKGAAFTVWLRPVEP